MSNDIKLKVLMGLPGSGKSTYADEYGKKHSFDVCVMHIDDIKSEMWYNKDKTMKDFIISGLRLFKKGNKEIVLDGLFLTNEDVEKAIITIAEHFKEVKVEVHRWLEDREKCLKNDGGRRETKSATTILNAPYEELNIEHLNEILKDYDAEIIKVVEHSVVLKPDWVRHFRPYVQISKDGKLRSEKWATGGALGNCWDSHLSPVSPDDPLDFKAFDDLLEEICPNITFLHYKKLRKECIETEDSYESDYYGGGTNYLNWVCDLEKVYNSLKELGY